MALNVSKLKALRVEGRRKSRDPFADTFDDDSDADTRKTRSTSRPKQSAPEKEKPPGPAPPPAKNSISSPFASIDILHDSDDDFLKTSQRRDRHPSPAPAQIPLSRVSDGAGRRGSLDAGLQSKSLLGGGAKPRKAPRSAVALAAGTLAYLDDSESEKEEEAPRARGSAANRFPSPAPRKQSDPVDPLARSATPRGTRETVQTAEIVLPPKHTVASPFAGTKYLEDSDSDEEAVTSRSGSVESTTAAEVAAASPEKEKPTVEVKRVDKPKQNGGGVSWRAFSLGRAEQRTSEIEALQASLKQRGKSISFGTHAITDDGNRVPLQPSPEQIFSSARGRRKGRGKSPPRRAADVESPDGEGADVGAGIELYDPQQFKTSILTAIQQETPPTSEIEIPHDHPRAPYQPSGWTVSPTSDGFTSPTDGDPMQNSTGSLTSKTTVSPPQTIPEGKSIDGARSPMVMSPSEEWFRSPLSRNSSAREIRIGSRPTRIPGAGSRRASRRSTSANPSPSPAHAFLSSWSRDSATETAPEPQPDDEGQAIGPRNEYIIGRTISRGGFGVVKEVHTLNSAGEPIVRAVKIVRKTIPGKNEIENEQAQQELEHEVSIWRHLKHRHILNLIEAFDTDFATFCVMELNVGGTLFDVVKKSRACASENDGRKGLEPKLAKSYAFQLACALRYLHEDIRVCHRDIKLENCLVDMSTPNADTEGGLLRLCDFGLADFLHNENSVDEADLTERFGSSTDLSLPPPRHIQPHPTTSSIIGTLEYASPKGLSVHRKLFETAGDMWAFGVVVYALVTGDLPFRHSLPSKTVEMILLADWDGRALEGAAREGGGEVRELVAGCLERDVDLRLTVGEVLRSEWFLGCVEGGEGAEGWD